MDPYQELDVAKDATAEEISKAYRRRARKTHPDAGGTADAFGRTVSALAILTDPISRRRFDETGEAREEPIDQKRVAALQMIEMLLMKAVSAYAAFGFSHSHDPRNQAVVVDMRFAIAKGIENATDAISQAEKHKAFLADMRDRFTNRKGGDPANPIRRSFDNQIVGTNAVIEDARVAIETSELALEILAHYDFRQGVEPDRGSSGRNGARFKDEFSFGGMA